MKKRKLALLCAAAMTLAGVFTACGDASSSDKESSTASAASIAGPAEIKGEKIITIGSGQTCDTLDPVQSYNGWYIIRFGVSETLTKMEDDMSISSWVAESCEPSEDNTTWTFKIRDNVTFSNGNPVTAEAVKNSIQNVFDNGTRGPEYFTPESMEAEGQILTIHCTTAEPILPNKLADPLFCIIDTSVDMSQIADEGPVGCGPFKVESFEPTTRECVVVKNENYWNGEVKTDKIDFVYTEDQNTLTMGLQAEDFDAVYNVSMTDIDKFADDAYTIVRTASGRTTHGFMNQNGPLKDSKLRQAILRSLDKETYCQSLLNGQYVAGKTLITSSAPQYGYNELTDPNAYDPESAAQLLDEGGYKDVDGDGWREMPDGSPLALTFVYYQGRPEQQVVVEATQAELSKLGVRINIEVNETQTVIDRLGTGDYDLLCMSINVLNCADPENHMNSYFKSGGTYAQYGWKNEQFDALLDELTVTADADQRFVLVKQAEQILLDDAVCIYYCYPLMNFVMKSNVSGITSTPADYYWVSKDTDIQ